MCRVKNHNTPVHHTPTHPECISTCVLPLDSTNELLNEYVTHCVIPHSVEVSAALRGRALERSVASNSLLTSGGFSDTALITSGAAASVRSEEDQFQMSRSRNLPSNLGLTDTSHWTGTSESARTGIRDPRVVPFHNR